MKKRIQRKWKHHVYQVKSKTKSWIPDSSDCLASRPPAATDENQIQKWLNHKFPQGFADLEKSLERLDTKQMGTVGRPSSH